MMNPAALLALPLWFSVAAVSGSDGLDCTRFNPEKGPMNVGAADVSRKKELLNRLIECIETRGVNVDGLYFKVKHSGNNNNSLRTGLMLAVELCLNDLAREFLHLDADVNVANHKGNTAAVGGPEEQ